MAAARVLLVIRNILIRFSSKYTAQNHMIWTILEFTFLTVIIITVQSRALCVKHSFLTTRRTIILMRRVGKLKYLMQRLFTTKL